MSPTRSSHFSAAQPDQGFSQHASAFAGGAKSSMFTLFPPQADDAEPTRGVAQIAPKLNAQTLFAFGVSSEFVFL